MSDGRGVLNRAMETVDTLDEQAGVEFAAMGLGAAPNDDGPRPSIKHVALDYDRFNQVRTMSMNGIGLDPLPASTGTQARICRTDHLVEIEAIAIIPRD